MATINKDFIVKNGIRVGGDIIPEQDSAFDLGSADSKFKDLYLSGNTIFLGDITLKDVNGTLGVYDSTGSGSISIEYDNSTSGLSAETLKDAIDELDSALDNLSSDAVDINYDNSTSGLSSDNVQGAIDLLDSALDNLSSDAVDINFDNSTNGFVAIDVQNAIEEVQSAVDAITHEADEVIFDNSTSGLSATFVQGAIDEIDGTVDDIVSGSQNITFNNTTSGLTATNIKAAIDEVSANNDSDRTQILSDLSSAESSLQGSIDQLSADVDSDRTQLLSDLSSTESSLQSSIDGVQSNLDSDVGVLETSITTVQSNLQSNLDSDVGVLETSITTVQSNLDSDVGVLETSISDTYTSIVSGGVALTNIDKIDLDTANPGTPSVGGIAWNPDETTFDMKISDSVTLQVGQEIVISVQNDNVTTIANSTVVMAVGADATSKKILVDEYDGDQAKAKFIVGMATEQIAGNGGTGLVTKFGKVNNVNASGSTVSESWSNGDVLYAHPSGNGSLTNVEPDSDEAKLAIAYVLNNGSVDGALFVRVEPVDLNHHYADIANLEAADAALQSNLDSDVSDINTALGTKVDKITVAGDTVGSSTAIPVITFNNQGQITSASESGITVGDATITVAAGSGMTGGGNFTTNQAGNETITINHEDTSSASSVNNSNGTVIQDVTIDTFGHATGFTSVNLDSRYYTETEADNRFVNTSSDTMTGFLTLHADPTESMHAATKNYVDTVSAEGLHVQDGCDAATTTTLASISSGTVTYDNGTSGVGATLTTTGSYSTIDGVNLSSGSRVLVKDESNTSHNGIYIYTSATVLTRSDKFDSDPEVQGGDFVYVVDGTTNGGTGWVQTETVDDIGVDAILFSQFSGAGTYTAGTGISITDTTISHGNTSGLNGSYGQTGGEDGTYIKSVTVDANGHLTAVTSDDLDNRYLGITATASNSTQLNSQAASYYLDYTNATNKPTIGSGTLTVQGTGVLGGSGTFSANATSGNTISITHDNSGVTAGSYGSGSAIPTVTVDATGHVTGISTTAVNTYDGWNLRTDGTSRGTISENESVEFVGGSNVSLSYSSTNNAITINSTDTNTTYSAGSGLSLSGTTFSHTDTSSQASVNNSGRTYIQDITLDTYGHITGITSATETVVNTWRGIDDTPVNGQTAESISSNWAYDHAASSTAHPRDTRNQIAGTYNTIIGTDTDINTSGATIIDNIYVTDGVITSMGTRNMTLADLGYTGETNATADQSATEIRTLLKTVDGSGSGIDADLLDGQHGSYYRINVYNNAGTLLN